MKAPAPRSPAHVPAAAAKPVLKWAGGKAKLLPEIMKRIPLTVGRYHEPFVGGGALFFALANDPRLKQGAILSDVNPDIANLYRALAWDADAVIAVLRKLERAHRRQPIATFARIRQKRNRTVAELARRSRDALVKGRYGLDDICPEWAARTLYLNRTCFNGLWRVNTAGEFNVPLGAYDHAKLDIARADELALAQLALLGRLHPAAGAAFGDAVPAIVHRRDYIDALNDAKEGDLVYCDPPYVQASPTANFTSYTSGRFGMDRQRELAAALTLLARCGAHVIASNADTPHAREIYADSELAIATVDAPRAINSRDGGRGKVGELIITSRHSFLEIA